MVKCYGYEDDVPQSVVVIAVSFDYATRLRRQ